MVRDDAFGHSFSLAFILAFILVVYYLDHSCHFRLLGIYLPYIYTGLCIGMRIEPMTFRGVDPGTLFGGSKRRGDDHGKNPVRVVHRMAFRVAWDMF